MIYILTVYDSLNYGSYLQAIALQSELEQYDTVAFLDIDHQSTLKQCLKKVAGHLVKRRFKGIGFELKKWNIFRICTHRLPVVHMNHLPKNDKDIYIFGSDEIWNISRKKFLKSPEFWGIGLKKGRYISYAPSINTATLEQYNKHSELIDALKKFDCLSVRDDYSKDVLNNILHRQIAVVCDPTFLFGIQRFKRIENKANEKEPYLLIYTYGKMCKTSEQSMYIQKVARKQGWKIISAGKYLKWADKSVNTTPEGFLGYVDGAQYIITDTFHGTVFSILYRKNFIAVNPAEKIKDLINRFGLNVCVISDVSQLETHINQETDYSKVDNIQCNYVTYSREYLKGAIKKAERI